MGPVSAEIEIDASRDDVFEALRDLSRRPAFTDHFISDPHLTRVDSSGPGAGTRFRFGIPGRSIWMDSAIAEEARPLKLVERGWGGRENRVQSILVWELEQRRGSLTTVHVRHRLESPHPVDGLLDTVTGASLWYRRGWRRALRRLRNQLESGSTPATGVAVAGTSPHMSVAP